MLVMIAESIRASSVIVAIIAPVWGLHLAPISAAPAGMASKKNGCVEQSSSDGGGGTKSHIESILDYARPGAQFNDRSARRHIQYLTEIGKQFLLDRCRALVSNIAADRVAIRSYTSDGTPILTDKAWTRQLGEKRIRRRGKGNDEFIVDRTYVGGYTPQGDFRTAVAFREPFALTQGKSGWALLAVAQSACPTLRGMGHFGPAIENYCFDRGCYSVLARRLHQVHLREASRNLRPTAAVEALTNIVVASPDCLHDIFPAATSGGLSPSSRATRLSKTSPSASPRSGMRMTC